MNVRARKKERLVSDSPKEAAPSTSEQLADPRTSPPVPLPPGSLTAAFPPPHSALARTSPPPRVLCRRTPTPSVLPTAKRQMRQGK